MRRRRHPAQVKIKVPKQTAPVTLKPAELTAAYKGVLTADVKERVAALVAGLKWYDASMPGLLTGHPLNKDQQKTFVVATKARNLGLQAPGPEEQEVALLTCIRKYESVWPSVPKIDPFYDEYKANKAELEAKQAVIQAKLNEILMPLNQAFGVLNVSFTSAKAEKLRQVDGEGKVILSEDLIKTLTQKAGHQGVIPVLFSEAHTALYAASIENGQVNWPKLAKQVPVMFEGILKYCGSVPRNQLFKTFGAQDTVTATVSAKAPRTPRTPGVKTSQPGKRSGVKAGTYSVESAKGIIWQRLSDEQEHLIQDVLTGIVAKSARERLDTLMREGKKAGNWQCKVTGDKVQMTILNPAMKPVAPTS